MSSKSLAIDLIRTDGGTQMRAELDKDVYLDYRDKFLAGVEFPPLDVFYDGAAYWLADGFHRFYGAREAKRGSVKATVHTGTQRDAILFAVGANTVHGLRRSNADKRNCVLALLNDESWVKWSDNRIAEQAAVSVQTVCNVRKELSNLDSSPAAKAKDEARVGEDGKKRKPPKRKSEPRAELDEEGAMPASKISGGITFDVDEIESKGKPKNGSVKRDFDDKAVSEAFRKLVRGLDDFYDDILKLYHDRKETLGGAGYGEAVRIAKASLNHSHDRANEAFQAFKKWSGA